MIKNSITLAIALIMGICTNSVLAYVYWTADCGRLDFFDGNPSFNLTNSLSDEQKDAIERGTTRAPLFADAWLTLVDNNDSDYFLGSKENEIYMTPEVRTSACAPRLDTETCQVVEADIWFGNQVMDWITDEDSTHLPYVPYVSSGQKRPMTGTAVHESGHCLGMWHESRYYNMMGMSYKHVTRNGTTTYYGPGEDLSNGLIALYGKRSIDQSLRDVGVTVMRWDYAATTSDGDAYSEHRFGVLRDSAGIELPVVGSYVGQNQYAVDSGQSIRMEITLENNGEQNTEEPMLGFYISDNHIISSADLLLDIDVPTLGRNTPLETEKPLTIPANLIEGDYFLGAYIDHDNQIQEVTARNNVAYYPIHVTGIPDLIVLSPEVNDTTLFTGESFSFSADVKNQGTGTSPTTTLRYYVSINDIISIYDDEIGTESTVTSLAPGATASPFVTTATAPTTFGTYWIGACVMPVSGESPTTNNCSEGVGVSVYDRPDLSVWTLVGDSNSLLYPGQTFDIIATVWNEGAGSSESTILHYYRSSNDNITAYDTEIGTAVFIREISPYAFLRAKTTTTGPAAEGIYWIGACVEHVSGDLNLANDCSPGVQVTVTKEETSCSDNTVDPVIGGDVEYRGEASCIASVSITTEPTVVLKNEANVYYEAPAIIFRGGFSAEMGSIFRAVTPP